MPSAARRADDIAAGQRESAPAPFDRELAGLPQPMRWRAFMGRVEAAVFASPKPLSRETLAALVGRDCVFDDLIADIRDELKARPYDLVTVAGGYAHRTRAPFADAISRALGPEREPAPNLGRGDIAILAAVAHDQPASREALSQRLGRDVSRDSLARLKRLRLLAAGPRIARPGAPATYVTTQAFLDAFGLESLMELMGADELNARGA